MNKKIKNTLVAGALASITLSSTPLLANGFASSLDVGVQVEGRVTSDSTYNSDTEMVTSRISNAEIRATLALREGLKAVIAFELANAVNGTVGSDDIEAMIEEAYIEFDANGKALIRVGRQQIPFANQIAASMAIPENDQRYDLTVEKDVIAIVVQLPSNTLGMLGSIIDSLEVAVFETGRGDFGIAETAGGSFRATKQLSEQMSVMVSGLMRQTAGDNEYRGAVSVSYQTASGWTFFGEGIVMENNPTYPGADFAGTISASRQLGAGVLVLQASAVDQYGEQLGASYYIPLSGSVTLSPEVRYDTTTEESTLAVRLTVQGQATYRELMGELPSNQ